MGDILEILVEEQSMAEFLRGVLPKILPKKFILNKTLNKNCCIHVHQGNADLRRSIPKKVLAYRGKSYKNKVVHLVILHDQDSSDCKELKRKLQALVDKNRDETQRLQYKITIICRELENWYLGDLDALEKVFPKFNAQKHKNKSTFRDGDAIHVSGNTQLKTLIDTHGKTKLARDIAPYLDINKNTSSSFKNFITGIIKLTN